MLILFKFNIYLSTYFTYQKTVQSMSDNFIKKKNKGDTFKFHLKLNSSSCSFELCDFKIFCIINMDAI